MDPAIPCLYKGHVLGSTKLATVLGIVTVFIWQIMCYVLEPNVEYGRNLKSKVSYKVLNIEAMREENIEAMREENIEALREETAVIIYNLPMAPCVRKCAQKNTATNLIKPKMRPLC